MSDLLKRLMADIDMVYTADKPMSTITRDRMTMLAHNLSQEHDSVLGVYQAALSEVVNEYAKSTGRDNVWAAQYHFSICERCNSRYTNPPLTGDHILDTRTLYDLQDKVRKLEHNVALNAVIAENWKNKFKKEEMTFTLICGGAHLEIPKNRSGQSLRPQPNIKVSKFQEAEDVGWRYVPGKPGSNHGAHWLCPQCVRQSM